MQKKNLTTSIANWLRYNRRRAGLDESAKQLLSNLVVLAWILKYSVEELSEYDVEEIEDMIEGGTGYFKNPSGARAVGNSVTTPFSERED